MVRRVEDVLCRRYLTRQERKYLERKRWTSRQLRRYRFNLLFSLILCLAVIIGGLFTSTYSYFRTGAENKDNYFAAASIDGFMKISPGKARATFPAVGNPSGETRPVASEENGELVLHFGEVVEGCSRNFDDVLRLSNIAVGPLNIRWRFEGEIASLLNTPSGEFVLLPGEGTGLKGKQHASNYPSPHSLDFKLDVESSPGTYEGYLVVTANGEFLSARIPARAVVREKNEVTVPPLAETTADGLPEQPVDNTEPAGPNNSGDTGAEDRETGIDSAVDTSEQSGETYTDTEEDIPERSDDLAETTQP